MYEEQQTKKAKRAREKKRKRREKEGRKEGKECSVEWNGLSVAHQSKLAFEFFR